MKKFLLSLCVTMLSVVGVWAQDEPTAKFNFGGQDVTSLELDVTAKDVPIKFEKAGNWSASPSISSSNAAICQTTNYVDWQNQFYLSPQSAGDADIIVKEEGWVNGTFISNEVAVLKVHVFDKTLATSLSVPSTATVAKGFTTTLDVTFAPETAEGFQVSCAPTDGGVSAYLSADSKKLTIQATASPASENYTVTVTPKAGSSAEAATVNVTVVDPVSIESIELSPNPKDILVGEKVTLVPTFTPEDPASKHLTWSSSETSIATVDENGVVTGVARGTVTITATSDNINGNAPVEATATINVTEELSVNDVKPASTLRLGETYTSELAVTTEGVAYATNYESSNPSVLSVTEDGTLTAESLGTAQITVSFTPSGATLADNQYYTPWTRTMTVKVTPAEYGLSIAASPATASAVDGGTITVTPSVTLNDETVTSGNYTVAYSLEGAKDGVSIDEATGEVTVPAGVTVQQFTIVATLTPTGDDAANYKGAVTKTGVLVAGSSDAKVTISVVDGVYVVNVPTPGAFGSISDNPTVILEGDATLDGLKSAEKVKVTGLLSMSDMRELNHLIGDQANVTEGVCKSLDMGESQLSEEVTKTFMDSNNGWYVDFIDGNDYWQHRMLYVENLTLPQPCPSYTVLPEGMFNWVGGNTSHLDALTIPEGWTKAADNCWSPDNVRSALVNASALSLPNSLTYIGANAFNSVKCPVLMIPPYVEYIGAGAFSSTDPCAVADVYFTGKIAPKYVDQNAFGSLQQMANNTVDNSLVSEDGRADRNILTNGGKLLCIMHYPAGCEDEYIDVTRIYSAMDRFGDEPKDFITLFNAGWTPEQLAAIEAARAACTNNPQMRAFPFTGTFDPGYNDLTVADRVWPSQELLTGCYSLAWLGFKFDGTDMRDDAEWMAKRGLYQFVTTMGDAPTDPHNWEFSGYENDKWYTINVPFDMSPAQIKKVFGEDTQVCRFSKVTRNEEPDAVGNVGIVFEFRNSVMTSAAYDGDLVPSTGNKATYHDASQQPIIDREDNYAGFTGIVHGVPYMIQPKGNAETSSTGSDGQIKRVFEGYKLIGEANVIETVVANDGTKYSFVGTRRETPLVAGTYFFGRKEQGAVHKFYYYAGGEKMRTPYTAAIFAEDGGYEDGVLFFGLQPTSAKAQLVSVFGDSEGVNAIENVTIVCGNDVIDNKVYSIGGQLMNSKNLPAGLYIKNGKKFVVK